MIKTLEDLNVIMKDIDCEICGESVWHHFEYYSSEHRSICKGCGNTKIFTVC